MSEKSNISWTDSTHNFWRGCHHAGSPGCDHCYARTYVNRFGDFSKRVRSKDFDVPLRWNKKPWICNRCEKAFNFTSCPNEDCVYAWKSPKRGAWRESRQGAADWWNKENRK
jgi:hypothetical protein